jgi:hypothetical protein
MDKYREIIEKFAYGCYNINKQINKLEVVEGYI